MSYFDSTFFLVADIVRVIDDSDDFESFVGSGVTECQ